jgi:hypothetical protein
MLGSAWWPVAVDLPSLSVTEAPLQDLAQHHRPAAEGGDKARDLRLRPRVQLYLQAGVVAWLARPVVGWCIHRCLSCSRGLDAAGPPLMSG